MMSFLRKALMKKRIYKSEKNIKKRVKLINHDCLLILLLLHIMLYIMLAYLMLFAALFNAVCLRNAFFLLLLPLIFANAFCFHTLSWFIDTVRLIHVLIFIMHSAFNLLYPNFMFTPFFMFFCE